MALMSGGVGLEVANISPRLVRKLYVKLDSSLRELESPRQFVGSKDGHRLR